MSGAVENDPTIFYFEYQVTDERDGRWLTAGGSSTVCFCGVLSFPRLPFGTCRPRGCSNIFRGKYCSNREREREREREMLYILRLWWFTWRLLRSVGASSDVDGGASSNSHGSFDVVSILLESF